MNDPSPQKSSVWFNANIRVRLPLGTNSMEVQNKMVHLIHNALDKEYGEDLKGTGISVEHDPNNILYTPEP